MTIRYTSSDGKEFEIVAVYCPNEEPDTWVKYRNKATQQEYTCRKEAFDARFTELQAER